MLNLSLLLIGTGFLFLLCLRTRIPLVNVLLVFVSVITLLSDALFVAGTPLTFLDIAFSVVVLSLLASHILNRNAEFVTTPFDGWILAFVLVNLIVVIVSVNAGNALGNAIREFFCYLRVFIGVYVFVNVLDSRNDLRSVVAAAFVLCFLACCVGIWQAAMIEPQAEGTYTDEYGRVRIFSFFGNPNTYAAYLELMFYPCLSLFRYYYDTRAKLPAALLLSLLALISVNMLLTLSRGVFVSTLVGTLLFVVFRSRNRTRLLLYGGIVGIPVVLAFVAFFGDAFARQINLITQFPDVLMEYTLLHRIAQYAKYVEVITRYPVMGMGWGVHQIPSFTSDFVRSSEPILIFGGLNGLYFDLALKSGLISLAVFCTIFVAFVVYVTRSVRRIGAGRPIYHFAVGVVFAIIALSLHHTIDNLIKFGQFGFFVSIFMAVTLKGIYYSKGSQPRYVLQ